MPAATASAASRALLHYPGLAGAHVRPLGGGLINLTFLVEGGGVEDGGARAVLQRVNPIFPPAIHEDIRAVTGRLAAAGVPTPALVPAGDGRLWVDLGADGIWRVMTHVAGASFDRIAGAAQARSAGALLGRFHRALDGMDRGFASARIGVHDTAAHLARLERALVVHADHRLHAPVAVLADEIASSAIALPALPALAPRVGHGDPKLDNLLFEGAEGAAAEHAVCLVDLDTVGPMHLAHEMGDALRSWCNPRGEDEPYAALDLDVARAALDGYREGRARRLDDDERRALLLGPEWVSLELATRFATDALVESYFAPNPARASGRGEQNLVRARGQTSLHRALVAARPVLARALGLAIPA